MKRVLLLSLVDLVDKSAVVVADFLAIGMIIAETVMVVQEEAALVMAQEVSAETERSVASVGTAEIVEREAQDVTSEIEMAIQGALLEETETSVQEGDSTLRILETPTLDQVTFGIEASRETRSLSVIVGIIGRMIVEILDRRVLLRRDLAPKVVASADLAGVAVSLAAAVAAVHVGSVVVPVDQAQEMVVLAEGVVLQRDLKEMNPPLI
jgi:hypothetical protein